MATLLLGSHRDTAIWLRACRSSLATVLTFLAFVLPGTTSALPIVSVTESAQSVQPTGFLIGTGNTGEQILATSWSATSAYTDVGITALLSGQFRGTAYLTTTIGPGTSVAETIATAMLDVNVNDTSPTDIAIFSALSLAPGSYFLVLEPSNGSSGNWWRHQISDIVLDAGVTLGDTYNVLTDNADTTYAPALGFNTLLSASVNSLAYTVTGNRAAVPEPATGWLLLGIAAAAVLVRSDRRTRKRV